MSSEIQACGENKSEMLVLLITILTIILIIINIFTTKSNGYCTLKKNCRNYLIYLSLRMREVYLPRLHILHVHGVDSWEELQERRCWSVVCAGCAGVTWLQYSAEDMADKEETEKTIAEDLVVTKYKMAGEIVNRKGTLLWCPYKIPATVNARRTRVFPFMLPYGIRRANAGLLSQPCARPLSPLRASPMSDPIALSRSIECTLVQQADFLYFRSFIIHRISAASHTSLVCPRILITLHLNKLYIIAIHLSSWLKRVYILR